MRSILSSCCRRIECDPGTRKLEATAPRKSSENDLLDKAKRLDNRGPLVSIFIVLSFFQRLFSDLKQFYVWKETFVLPSDTKPHFQPNTKQFTFQFLISYAWCSNVRCAYRSYVGKVDYAKRTGGQSLTLVSFTHFILIYILYEVLSSFCLRVFET